MVRVFQMLNFVLSKEIAHNVRFRKYQASASRKLLKSKICCTQYLTGKDFVIHRFPTILSAPDPARISSSRNSSSTV